MKEKKIRKILSSWVLAVLLLVSLWVPGNAAQTGSIELQVPKGTEDLEMILYTVADYQDGGFTFSKEFAQCQVQISDLNNSEEAQKAAQTLADFAREQGSDGIKARPDENGLVRYEGLTPALYLAAQCAGEDSITVQPALVPIPYIGEGGTEIYDAVLTLKYSYPGGDTLVTKVDARGGVLAGAQFVLHQKMYLKEGMEVPAGAETGSDDQGNYYWKEFAASLVSNDNGQIVIQDMPKGDYRLVEIKAPDGYILGDEPSYFTVDEYGKVTETDGVYMPESENVTQVQVENQPTSLIVEKLDPEGNLLPGAKLMVKNLDGTTIFGRNGKAQYVFTTEDEPSVLYALPPGEYVVTELAAPEGYRICEDVRVTVSDEPDADNYAALIDEEEESSIYSLTVKKSLTDLEGMPVAAKDGVFYVALFADEDHTQRVSSVLPIYFQGQSSGSATFRNLIPGEMYYVGETDEFGNYLSTDLEEDENTFFVPVYPDDTSVTIDEETQETIYSFENVFVQIPDGFYYSAELTLTKKVLKGGEAYDTDNVYYCALFRDEACTQRFGDVIELPMEGGSETSVVMTVEIGDSQDSVTTYYVKETDENGVPLENSDSLEFTIQQDKDSAEVSYEHNTDEVVITNTYKEKLTPTPAAATPVVTPGTPNTPGSSTPYTTGDAVKTGDDTPVALYLLLLAATAAISVFLVMRKKRTK